MKNIISLSIVFSLLFCSFIHSFAIAEESMLFSVDAEYTCSIDACVPASAQLMTYAKAVVLMERSTGRVLYAENENEKLFPASVTKIMSILLVCEALETGKINIDDVVACSENAASKGGSQIWLEAGEKMSVEELLKATCIYSANDACTLLGEYVAGSETAFNNIMNERASQLGMKNTHFDNCTGLDDTTDTHLTTAYDVALMARELLRYDFIQQYTTTWMDSLRGGETQLVNTNKLIRTYDGITGLKTGTTEKAGCCVCATAERDSMELIAVVLGSENSSDRFSSAENLLDWGFANYEIITPVTDGKHIEDVKVNLGVRDCVSVKIPEPSPVLINKGKGDSLSCEIKLHESITAPVTEKSEAGTLIVSLDGKVIAQYTVYAGQEVERLNFFNAISKIFQSFSK